MVLMKKQNQRKFEPRVVHPLVNIYDGEKEVVLEAEMAGLTRDDISVDLKGNELTLRGKSRQAEEPIPKGYTAIYRERCPLEYARTFIIGDDIDKDEIEARYENGILSIKMAKSESIQPKKIAIKD